MASVEHGKKMPVSVHKPFIVGGHDFIRSSLTPSVALFVVSPSMDPFIMYKYVLE